MDSASATDNVYVKCPNTSIAVSAVNVLHGRWFAGKVITTAYIPADGYFANLVGAATFCDFSDALVYTSKPNYMS